MKKQLLTRFAAVLVAGVMLNPLSPQSANASGVLDCMAIGGSPETGGYCALEFDADASQDSNASFTVPKGATNLQMVLVGGGSGAYYTATNLYGPPYETFGGNAGKIRYVDLSSLAVDTTVTIVIGRSGVAGQWATSGNDTSITYGTTTVTAPGGVAPTATDTTCTFIFTDAGNYTYTHPGKARQGSSAVADSVVNNDGSCGTLASGVEVSTDNDSYGNAPLSLFGPTTKSANYTKLMGSAGAIQGNTDINSVYPVRVQGVQWGDGGSVVADLRIHASDLGGEDGLGRPREGSAGGPGAVFIRFNYATQDNSGGGTGGGGTDPSSEPTTSPTTEPTASPTTDPGTGGTDGGTDNSSQNASDNNAAVEKSVSAGELASTGPELAVAPWIAFGVIAIGLTMVNYWPRTRGRSARAMNR